MKVIDSIWFTSEYGNSGIVLAENERGERKLYAGAVSGLNQEMDEKIILDWGTKINIPMLKALITKATKKSVTKKKVKSKAG